MSIPVEHDYIGLSEACLMETKMSCSGSSPSVLKETELKLGLPGSWSPERKTATELSLFAKDLVDKNTLKIFVSGAKRGFSDTCKKCEFSTPTPMAVEDKKSAPSHGNGVSHASKAQVVGWPPVRSFRKKSVGSYVKVSMDGAPYLRKVDVKTYTNYAGLLSALEKMFTCFTIGLPGLSERHSVDLLNGSEYVLTYQDKDGDWMLLGDVPWEMFIDSCKRMRIMKSSEAIGLAPRVMSKSKNQFFG